MRILASVGLIVLSMAHVPRAEAATINVPANQPTIQDAVNVAASGDTIMVAAGTYNENVTIAGTTLQVISVSGPQVTTINGGQNGSVVTISGCGPGTQLTGFTITNGYNNGAGVGGGGVLIKNSTALISGNIITQNQALYAGGGIEIFSGRPPFSRM